MQERVKAGRSHISILRSSIKRIIYFDYERIIDLISILRSSIKSVLLKIKESINRNFNSTKFD